MKKAHIPKPGDLIEVTWIDHATAMDDKADCPVYAEAGYFKEYKILHKQKCLITSRNRPVEAKGWEEYLGWNSYPCGAVLKVEVIRAFKK